ncbi:hypothetical protein [Tessaracoccus terricola]
MSIGQAEDGRSVSVAARAVGVDTPGRHWPTVPEIAEDVRANVAAGDTGHALRMLMDGVNRLPSALGAGRLDEALTEPPTTGDHAWDALLRGAIRYRLHELERKAPSWTRVEPLNQFWWPVAYSKEKAYVDMAHTPAELMRIGIFIDEREFTQAWTTVGAT